MKTLDKCSGKINITVTVKGNKISFESEIITCIRNEETCDFGIVIKPVMNGNNKIYFHHYPTVVEYYDGIKDRVYTFHVSKVDYRYKKDFYAIYSKDSVNPVNTRRAFRIHCGYRMSLSKRDGEHTISGFCKDISFTGAGIVMTDEYCEDIEVGDYVTLSIFNNKISKQCIVRGNIVRKVDLQIDKTLLGIEFNVVPKDISDMVNMLQTDMLKKRSK